MTEKNEPEAIGEPRDPSAADATHEAAQVDFNALLQRLQERMGSLQSMAEAQIRTVESAAGQVSEYLRSAYATGGAQGVARDAGSEILNTFQRLEERAAALPPVQTTRETIGAFASAPDRIEQVIEAQAETQALLRDVIERLRVIDERLGKLEGADAAGA